MEVNRIETFLKFFMVAWQMARIYELKHPKFITALDAAFDDLTLLLKQRQELVIGIFGDELASGEDIFFEFSQRVIASIDHLKNMGIEKITFSCDIQKEELVEFIVFLMTPIDAIDRPAQEYLALKGINHISVDKLSPSGGHKKEKAKDIDIKLSHYKACLENSANIFEELLGNGAIDSLRLQFISRDIMKYFMGDHRIFIELAKVKGHDLATFSHLINVSTLSVYFAYKLGFSREDCIDVGTAALFHDIGKLFIAKKILQKPEKLNTAEFAKVKSHAIIGAEILIPHKKVITELPALVAFEHHRNFDGSGYPKLPFSVKNHIASLMVSICDVYDALTSRRTYKADYPPEAIYKLMLRERGTRYHPELFDAFFKIIGVWPKSSIVVLSDSSIAIVRETNEDNIFSPKVEVVSCTPHLFIDLDKVIDLKIERTLNTLAEGKQYLELL
jgi:HD-GYP domain-containing protein (c-di-GMP phosphodiesterase class II)